MHVKNIWIFWRRNNNKKIIIPVFASNITGYIKKETDNEGYIEHKGLIGFAEYNEPIYLNLYNLSRETKHHRLL